MKQIKCGDKMIAVERGTVADIVVTKVGTKWVHFKSDGKSGKFCPKTMSLHNGIYGGIGRVFYDREHMKAVHDARGTWELFKRKFDYVYQAPASAENIRKAASLLGHKI